MHQVKWLENIEALNLDIPKTMQDLVGSNGSLSANLRAISHDLSVQILSQELTKASIEEKSLLNINNNVDVLVRTVNLCLTGEPVIHAKVVIPYATYAVFKNEIDNIGDKLFGEAFLTTHNFVRKSMEFALINDTITRRSIFMRDAHKILILEQFLHTLEATNIRV